MISKKTILLIGVMWCQLFFISHVAANPIGVAVSILPLAEFVTEVGGNLVDVTVMIPAGASPHSYEPTPKQMRDLKTSVLYVKVGSGVEFEKAWLDKILDINPQLTVCDTSQKIQLIRMVNRHHHTHTHEQPNDDEHHHHDQGHEHDHHAHKGTDPHIWLSPTNAAVMVKNIRDALIKCDPDHKIRYQQNAAAYISKINAVTTEIQGIINQLKTKKFLVQHPSWGYFARDFDLEQISIEIDGKEPSARDIVHLITFAQHENIQLVFASPQFSQKTAASIARQINGQVLMINPLPKKYLENLMDVTRKLSTIQ